ncbi:MAG: hypothetical protein ACJA2S_001645 [Cyclobacteriaceae bacterium]|jgi:hypothetical protein
MTRLSRAFLAVTFCLLISISSFAQTEKGNIRIGSSFKMNTLPKGNAGLFLGEQKHFEIGIIPNFSYFIFDGFSLGLVTPYY